MLNCKSRSIFCHDNLEVLQGLNSNCVDLIYLDPPFNKKKVFAAPIGTSAEGAEFKDIFTESDLKNEWVANIEQENFILHSLLKGIKQFSNKFNYSYCVYMAIRLIEIRRILKDSGSIYLHCDPTMSHYLKLVLDCIFGEDNFQREIIWSIGTSSGFKSQANNWIRGHDTIFYYSKNETPKFNKQYFTLDEKTIKRYDKVDKDGRSYKIYYDNERVERKVYLDKSKGRPLTDTWTDIIGFQTINNTGEYLNYPTQKPLALLERIIKASSKKGDVVLDPFCGCATTCIAAEKLERKWIGIDVSHKAYELVKLRLEKEVPKDLFRGEPTYTTIPPKKDEGGDLESYGYIYIISNKTFKTHLKVGIAKNPELRLSQYQTGDTKRGYKLEKVYKTKFNAEIEKLIHEHYNAPEEWVNTGDVEELYKLIQKIDKKLKNQN